MNGDEIRTARRMGRRAALGVVIAASTLFIGASTVQIIFAVFGLRTTPLASEATDSPERRCAVGISRLARALDRQPQTPVANPSLPEDVQSSAGEWAAAEGVRRSCTDAAGGLDAWAALLRLRQAQSELARSRADDLQPLRREVAAHLPADLR